MPDVQIAAQTFTFRELAAATNNFRQESFLGEGGFGRVYKGQLPSGLFLFPEKKYLRLQFVLLLIQTNS